MNKTQRRVGLAVLAAALTTSVLHTGSAAAAEADQSMGVTTVMNVVAEGLDTPRGVIYDGSLHRVLVAEAGQVVGNEGPCAAGNGGVIYCYGETGAVFEYTEHAGSRRIATGLPSIKVQDDSAVLGLHDLALYNGELTGVFGLSGRETFRQSLIDQGAPGAIGLGQTGLIDASGHLTPNGDLVTFEVAHNPDGLRVDSDPYGLLSDTQGKLVADAAGNDIVRVRQDGSTELFAYLPPRNPLPNPPFEDPSLPSDYESVPTSVVRGPDGAYYVGELTGFPTLPGTARILRVAGPGAAPTVYAEGFTNVIDFTFDDHGRLIVLEIDEAGVYQDNPSDIGRLVRVERNGSHTVLAREGLTHPGGVAYAGSFGAYSLFYVTNRTTGTGDTGQLLRLVVRG